MWGNNTDSLPVSNRPTFADAVAQLNAAMKGNQRFALAQQREQDALAAQQNQFDRQEKAQQHANLIAAAAKLPFEDRLAFLKANGVDLADGGVVTPGHIKNKVLVDLLTKAQTPEGWAAMSPRERLLISESLGLKAGEAGGKAVTADAADPVKGFAASSDISSGFTSSQPAKDIEAGKNTRAAAKRTQDQPAVDALVEQRKSTSSAAQARAKRTGALPLTKQSKDPFANDPEVIKAQTHVNSLKAQMNAMAEQARVAPGSINAQDFVQMRTLYTNALNGLGMAKASAAQRLQVATPASPNQPAPAPPAPGRHIVVRPDGTMVPVGGADGADEEPDDDEDDG